MELIILVIAFTGLALELVLGIITLWIFQRYLIYMTRAHKNGRLE